MLRVATVCGTRPELIKLAPLVPDFSAAFEHHYLFTGQHYSPDMVQIFVDELSAPAPDRYLDVGSSDIDALTSALAGALRDFGPDVVVCYGDTNSTLAAARAADDIGAVLVHIEAGIRSFDRGMPEEINRVEVDAKADLRLAPTGLATWFLDAFEGHDPVTSPAIGNLVVDAWVRHRDLIESRPLPEQVAGADRYAVLTLHRQATVDVPEVFEKALNELGSLDLTVFFPVHPRTADRLGRFGLTWPDNVKTCAPMGYLDFVRAMLGAEVLLTDSGGVQEEAITLGKPCVTLRPNTERMETVFLGGNRLFDLARHTGLADEVAAAVSSFDNRPYKLNPFGSGYATARTVALLQMLGGEEPTATFPEERGLASLDDLRRAAAAVRERRSQ